MYLRLIRLLQITISNQFHFRARAARSRLIISRMILRPENFGFRRAISAAWLQSMRKPTRLHRSPDSRPARSSDVAKKELSDPPQQQSATASFIPVTEVTRPFA